MIKRGQLKLAEAMLRPVNPAIIILLGIFTLIWGFWVGNPFWDVFSRAPLYSMMSSLPEWLWGSVAIIAGLIISYGAIVRGVHSLICGAAVGFVFWFVVSLMYFMGDWMNTGGITTAVFAVYSAMVYLNLRVNSRHFERDRLFTK